MADRTKKPCKTVRGTCTALRDAKGEWRAVLIRGKSGSGKSDLTLRLLFDLAPDRAYLIADDYVEIEWDAAVTKGGVLIASPPETIKGLLEVRGIGIVKKPFLAGIPLCLVIDLVEAGAVERLPEPESINLYGENQAPLLPLLKLAAFEASAVAKLLAFFDALQQT